MAFEIIDINKLPQRPTRIITIIFFIFIFVSIMGVFIPVNTDAIEQIHPILFSVSVTGDDINAHIFNNHQNLDITEMTIEIEGDYYTIKTATMPVIDDDVLYTNIADEIYGPGKVSLIAHFADGTSKCVWSEIITFA